MSHKKSNMLIIDAIIRFFDGRPFSCRQYIHRTVWKENVGKFGLAVRTMVLDQSISILHTSQGERVDCSH